MATDNDNALPSQPQSGLQPTSEHNQSQEQEPYRDDPSSSAPPRNADEESAPLLPTSSSPPAQGTTKAIAILTPLALTFAVSTLVLDAASALAFAVARERGQTWHPWSVQTGMGGVVIPAIFSVIISGVNYGQLRAHGGVVRTPLSLNLLLDLLIGYFILEFGIIGFSGVVNEGWTQAYGRKVNTPAMVVAGVALFMGILAGAAHTAMFITRCVVSGQSGWWKRPWQFADGQLTVELSVKLFSQAERGRQVGGGGGGDRRGEGEAA